MCVCGGAQHTCLLHFQTVPHVSGRYIHEMSSRADYLDVFSAGAKQLNMSPAIVWLLYKIFWQFKSLFLTGATVATTAWLLLPWSHASVDLFHSSASIIGSQSVNHCVYQSGTSDPIRVEWI